MAGLTPHEVHAVLTADTGATRILLEAGADPNAMDDDLGSTALHQAAWHGAAERLELLLAHGADRRMRDRTYGGTPGDWARHGGHPELAAALAERLPPDPEAPA